MPRVRHGAVLRSDHPHVILFASRLTLPLLLRRQSADCRQPSNLSGRQHGSGGAQKSNNVASTASRDLVITRADSSLTKGLNVGSWVSAIIDTSIRIHPGYIAQMTVNALRRCQTSPKNQDLSLMVGIQVHSRSHAMHAHEV